MAIQSDLFIGKWQSMIMIVALILVLNNATAQVSSPQNDWIRPENAKAAAVWGIRGGIVFSLWPYGIESPGDQQGGGPRGLIRVGYESGGHVYLINYIAIEPVVDNKIEFSEISPSKVDDQWGKLLWAGKTAGDAGGFYPAAITRGMIIHPNSEMPNVEELIVFIYMEQFLNGAHPYLKITIKSDLPEEIGLEIFNQKGSAVMQRCALTATMGNYSRLRLLYLKNKVVDARDLYKGFDGIGFVEKQGYPSSELMKDKNNNFLIIAASDETLSDVKSWPEEAGYSSISGWRYRPPFKLTQYWRKESAQYDPSLQVRVNGRAKYWSGGSEDKNRYLNIPGGPAFENFELRENYYAGQKFYFGITKRSPQELTLNGSTKSRPQYHIFGSFYK
ncbi:MAG: hypothetical protein ACOH2A_12135 [Sphingobacteriaceae bacterium]